MNRRVLFKIAALAQPLHSFCCGPINYLGNFNMCGAYSLTIESGKLVKRFKAKPPKVTYPKRYNIRPSQPLVAILNTDPEQMTIAEWGIVPFWDKTGKKQIINARKDSLEKATFKQSFHERRCLILADGFYEWKAVPGQKTKIPYRFVLKSEEPFAFAGIWQEKDDEPQAVIITTEPNELVGEVHNRMPAILRPETENEWLNPDLEPDQALGLLQTYPASKMSAYPVSTLVNMPRNDSVEVIKPAI
jgi:putative SOS response-associated peptidase YedK